MKNLSIPLFCLCCLSFFCLSPAQAQDANALLAKVKAKLQQVDNYMAEGEMATDVTFINIADSKVKVYFRQPDQFKIVKEDGISILPKGGMSVGLNSLLSGKEFIAVPGGYVQEGNNRLAVLKLLPVAENNGVVLSTLYVNEKDALVYRTITTTKDNGTYETSLQYGKYASWGLPDKVFFVFNISSYKLPKGVTMEYEGSKKASAAKPAGDGKGRVSITYSRYTINKGLPADLFK
ncbi:LolA family protein [Flavihumibacter profundi]|uniref:LolA family protein n=1 Tax=Flavihumibacter profundi TaxID=2716883 RepID=UPI001CC7E6E1|nr:hypothetical protein [Flavihumibacter profundi]MBZ5858110.1 hypothetical protein [Flavihumibacter profundi]